MSHSSSRRRFLARTAAGSALVAAGDLSFLSTLRPLGAEETQVKPGHVRLRPEIEPLVRLVEESPRDRLLELMADEIRRGTSYREVLAALMLAGVRNIKPRPVGFKFHAVLVVNSAHQASLASADRDRWLPLFWALDYFKGSQARDVQEGDWTMSALPDSALPPPDQARQRFIQAMDRWDEEGADAAVAQLARTAGAGDVWELFWRYGARDFRDIGHKAIYVANACRTLQVIGREHAEPVLRSLAFALLMRGSVNPAEADEPADRPWRHNLERAKELGPGALSGTRVDAAATREMLAAIHSGSPEDAAARAAALLKSGAAPSSVWDGVMTGAGELLMRKPGIVGIHCVTTANALHYAYGAASSDETRLLMLLQGAAFMPMFRAAMDGLGDVRLDRLEPLQMQSSGTAAVEEVLAEVSRNRMDAARKALGYLEAGGSAEALLAGARRLIFLKGTDSHDYKFSSAALEDYYHVTPEWRNRFLASAMFNLRGAGDRDNPLTSRIRSALSG